MQMLGTANLQRSQSVTDFASVCKTSAAALIYSSNAMKCVKVGQVLTEVETCYFNFCQYNFLSVMDCFMSQILES